VERLKNAIGSLEEALNQARRQYRQVRARLEEVDESHRTVQQVRALGAMACILLLSEVRRYGGCRQRCRQPCRQLVLVLGTGRRRDGAGGGVHGWRRKVGRRCFVR